MPFERDSQLCNSVIRNWLHRAVGPETITIPFKEMPLRIFLSGETVIHSLSSYCAAARQD